MSTGSKIFPPNVFLLIASKKAVVLRESTLKIVFNTAYVEKITEEVSKIWKVESLLDNISDFNVKKLEILRNK